MTINLENLKNINNEIKNCKNCELLIVTKNQDINDIRKLIDLGYKFFGENKLQEALIKYSQINNRDNIYLHMIGPLQTNKVKKALTLFNTIQSVDRKNLVDEISKNLHQVKSNFTNEFYIQVNIGSEPQKSGIEKNSVHDLYHYSITKNLNIVGLMCIPPSSLDPRIFFDEMVQIRDKINKNLKLSMGMSNDYKIALNCGSNLLRLGSKIFSK